MVNWKIEKKSDFYLDFLAFCFVLSHVSLDLGTIIKHDPPLLCTSANRFVLRVGRSAVSPSLSHLRS